MLPVPGPWPQANTQVSHLYPVLEPTGQRSVQIPFVRMAFQVIRRPQKPNDAGN
jgi:hypothetical protein